MTLPLLESLAPRDTLTLLYREHASWLQAWIRRRLGCRQQAADLTQATFCRLLEQGCAQPPRAPRGLLATVARRLLIDELRRREVEQAYADCHVALHGDADPLTPERIAQAAQLLHGLLALLATLPANVRRAFVLRRIDGLSHEEIASALGMSTRTVKRHVAQACLVMARMRGLDASLSSLDGAQRQLLSRAAADQPPRRTGRAALAVALVALTAGLLSMILREPAIQSTEQVTARGEQRTVELADRSTLLIDADTALSTHLGPAAREVHLRRGRVLATVAPDRHAPFTVLTPHATATALGTAYMVRIEPRGTRVTVTESMVRVCAHTATACVDLRAGQTVLVPAVGAPGAVRSTDTTTALAWTRGWLEADDLPLPEALAELAPRLSRPLRFDATALQALRVTGSYPLDRPLAALEAMAATAGLALETTPDGALQVTPQR